MKIGIVTFIDYGNYGNRLQNYALQKLLEARGYQVETILNEKYYDYAHRDCYYKMLPKHMIRVLFWKVYDLFFHNPHAMGHVWTKNPLMKERIQKNLEFSEQYIHETDYILHEGSLDHAELQKYDYVFVGSDQVWNPTMAGASDLYFLQNIAPEKRVAFAASIGLSEIPEDYIRQWKKYIAGMNCISVREESARQIVKETSGKDAVVLLDPTMLIGQEPWVQLLHTRKSEKRNPYILVYILGEISEQRKQDIEKLAMSLDAEVLYLNSRDNQEMYTIDAVEFVELISESEAVITDSFHACVFSILFHKNFWVLKRTGEYANIYSRIDDLLGKFDLRERAVTEIANIDSKVLSEDQIQKIENVLVTERNRAEQFLDSVFEK